MNTPAKQLLFGFEGTLRREGLQDGTRRKYGEAAREFVTHVGGTGEAVLAATKFDAEAYLDYLIIERDLSVPTVRLRIAALRRFFDHLDERELLDGRNPFARIKPPKSRRKPNDWLREDEDEAIRAACVTRQERIVHALLRYAGLRIGEAMGLVQRNIDLTKDELRVTVSKSDAGLRTIPIHPELRSELVSWLAHLEAKAQVRPDLPVLVTGRGTAMKAQFGWRLIKRVAARAEVRPRPAPALSEVTPHTLRRTFGTDLLNHGMRIESVSRLLGHADTRVTLDCYAELLPETIRSEAQAAWSR